MLLRSLIGPAVFLPSIAVAFLRVSAARALWWIAFVVGLVARHTPRDRRSSPPG